MKKTSRTGGRPRPLTLAGQAQELAAMQEDDWEEGPAATPKVSRGICVESIIDEKVAEVMDAMKEVPFAIQRHLEDVQSRFGGEITALRAALDAEREESRKATNRLEAAMDADRELHRQALRDLRKELAADAKASPPSAEFHVDLETTICEVKSKISKDMDELVRNMERLKETGGQTTHTSTISSVEALSKLVETMRSQFVGEVAAVRAELMKDIDAVQRQQIAHGADIATLQGKQRATDDVGEVNTVMAKLMKDVDLVQRQQVAHGASIATLQAKQRVADDNFSVLQTSLQSVGEVNVAWAKLMKDVDEVQRQQVAHGADIATLQGKQRAAEDSLSLLHTGLESARTRVSETPPSSRVRRETTGGGASTKSFGREDEAAAGSAAVSETSTALPGSPDAAGSASAMSRCSSIATGRPRHFLAQLRRDAQPVACPSRDTMALATAAAAAASAAAASTLTGSRGSVGHQQSGGVTVPQFGGVAVLQQRQG